jgi:DNA-directed RNA polymerase subunit E'/Rpb7
MFKKVIKRQVSLKPDELYIGGVKNNILNKLENIIKNGECSYDNGYILEIKRIIDYGNNYISNATNMIVFTVVFEAITLNPKIGSVMEGKVVSVHSSGIFVEIKEKIKVLISEGNMNGMLENIKKNDMIKLKISDIRYQNKKISCIGILLKKI